ncbi:MAG: hypothetical protein IH840_12895 [Candidatus Heimdallarchaeota archaeon]|nr:hypothetical protein [Candidatus Heimdallarchaeota archaeon]
MVAEFALIALEVEKQILTGLLTLIFLPWIVFILLRVVGRVLSFIFGVPTEYIISFFNFLFVPFLLVRQVLYFLVLGLMGWKIRMGFYAKRKTDNRKGPDNLLFGMSMGFSLYPPHRVTLREVIILFLVPYLLTGLYLFVILPSAIFRLYLLYLFGPTGSFWVYWYLTLGMLIMWVKIPESSIVVIQYVIVYYPHVLVAIVLNAISAILLNFLISPVSIYGDNPLPLGGVIASTWFLFWTLVVIYRSLLNQELIRLHTKKEISIIQDFIMEEGIY